MKFAFVLLVLICFLSGCVEDIDRPDNIYSPEKMAEVMIDVHIAERTIAEQRIKLDSAIALYHLQFLPEICSTHNVTAEKINKSLKWYSSNADRNNGLEKTYEIVVGSLDSMKLINN